MIEPAKPARGMDILSWCSQVLKYCRENRISTGPGLTMARTPSGTIISLPPRPPGASGEILPFEISTRGSDLILAPGTIHYTSHDELIQSAPADGLWRAEGKAVIDADTGEITSTAVQWVTTPSSNTATTFYKTIGTVNILDGIPASASPPMPFLSQYTFGPIHVLVHGAYDNPFSAIMV